ncbi:MAG: xanthine dehydrogenase accessory protein XdhC [Rhodobacteraceae bacterium HLUCCA08]|nr:MAG: xanthine dehydrogenase accessory protein XdhC [Rhodobacteraceae bacterium HLUCCA08]
MIRVRVADTRGSTPREVGAEMVVHADRIEGTIGGGALEFRAIATARKMLATGEAARRETVPLGPDLGQCCGGAVVLDFDRNAPVAPEGTPLWIWGAGHVGRALVATLAPLPGYAITWIDTAPERFPEAPESVDICVAARPPELVPHAPRKAHHLIVTYSHAIDLKLCDALLRRGFASAGLIGSATKWARFRSRLAELGHADAQISRIACPIGDPTLGKHPQAIAVGVAAALLSSGAMGNDGA